MVAEDYAKARAAYWLKWSTNLLTNVKAENCPQILYATKFGFSENQRYGDETTVVRLRDIWRL